MKHRILALLLALPFTAPSVLAQSAEPAARAPAPKSQRAAVSKPAAKPTALPSGVLGDIQLTQVRLDNAVRLLSQIGKINVVVTGKVAEQVVSLYLRDATAEDMVRNLCRAAGVWYRYDSGSKTYLIMSGEEYQKDLAIVRDEQTQVFTLRHHNVVSTANAIRALFGSRVQLNLPVEEMPPTSLGSGNRTSTSSGNKGSSSAGGSSNRSGNSGSGSSGSSSSSSGGSGASFDLGQSSGGSGSSARGAGASSGGNYDPSADLNRMSQDRLTRQSPVDASGQPVLSAANIQEMAARQGPPVYVTYNRLNNLLMVRSGDELSLKQIGQLVREMDKPPKQVLLEMKILEVTLDDGFRSVFDLTIAGKSTTTAPNSTGALVPTTSGKDYARNALSSGLFDLEQDATMVWQYMSKTLGLRFQLLAQENKLKVLSSPMLVASNNQPARLFIGDERVLTVGASSQSLTGTTGATNTTITVETEKRDIGQTLSILPRINGDRSVSLTIDQDSSTVKIGDATVPIATTGSEGGALLNFPIDTVNTASLQVTAHAQDGMTVAIGGMIRDSTQNDQQKVPVLGDIPLFGALFRRDVRSAVRSQIILLITPRVLESPDDADQLARKKEAEIETLRQLIPKGSVVPKLEDWVPGNADSVLDGEDFMAPAADE